MRRLCLLCALLVPGLLALPPVARAQHQVFLGKTHDKWAEQLSASSADARRGAAFALGKMGHFASSQVPKLIKTLESDKDAGVREAAAFALGEICLKDRGIRSAPGLLPALQKALSSDQNEMVKRSAAFALGCMGDKAANALEALNKAATEPSLAVKQNVAWALGKIGKSGVLTLQTILNNETDPLVVRDAANSVGELGKDARPAVPALAKHLKDTKDDPRQLEMRKSICAALVGLVSAKDQDATGPLRIALSDPEPEVWQNAVLALSNIGGPAAADAVPKLIQVLQNDKASPQFRRQAAAAFKNIGSAAKDALPVLMAALKDKDETVRFNAAVSLGGIGDPKALDALAQVVGDTSEKARVRESAAIALRDAGIQKTDEGTKARPELVKQLPVIVKVIENPKDEAKVRATALWPIRFLDPDLVAQKPEVVKALETIVTSEPKVPPTKMLRYDSACLLGLFKGPNISDAALKTLNEFLRDEEVFIYAGTSVGTGGSGTLEKGGGGAESVKKQGQGDGRVIAIQALTFIGSEGIRRSPEILKQLNNLANNAKDKRLKDETKKLLSSL
jgi:HEAT repeat protein